MTDPIRPQSTPSPVPQGPGLTTNWSATGSRGNRMTSQYGGPGYVSTPTRAPWGQSGIFGSVAGGGQPEEPSLPDEGIDRLGKTTLSLAPEVSSPVMAEGGPPEWRPGFFEGMLGGLVEAFTGIVPEPIRTPVVGLAQGIGQVLDIPGEALGHVPINQLFGLEDVEGAFKLLPLTPEKQQVINDFTSDPTENHWLMSQYLRSHSGDYAAAKGLPQVLSNLIRPDATIQERLFMALGIPAQMVSRTVAGAFGRAEELLAADPEALPEQLRVLRDRYLAGEYGAVGSEDALNRLTDEMVTAGFGWGNDPFISMLAEMLTDPIIVGGMGTGLAAASVRTGALAARASNIGRLARAAANAGDNVIQAAVKDIDDLLSAQGVKTGRLYDLQSADSTYRFASEFERRFGANNRIVQQAEGELSRRQRGQVKMAPFIEAAAKTSEVLNSPFGWFGKDGVAGIVARKFGRDTTQGAFAAYDIGLVSDVYGKVTNTTALNDALSYAIAFSQRSMMQGNLVRLVRMRLRDAKGRITGNAKLPDTMDSPTDIVRRMSEGDNPAMAQQMEISVRRQKKQYEPDTSGIDDPDVRKRSYDAQMVKMRDEAARKLAHAAQISPTEAANIVANGSPDLLAFIDYVHWGRTLADFTEAKRRASGRLAGAGQMAEAAQAAADEAALQAAEGVLDEYSIARRATLIGEREMTKERAVKILEDIEKAPDEATKVSIANAAISQYELLYMNLFEKTRITSDAHLIERVQAILKDGIDNERFVTTLKPENLPDELRLLRDDLNARGAAYEVGLAPATDKRWSPLYNEKNELVGYYPWMDIDMSPSELAKVEAPTRFDLFRERLMTPIRGENIMQESRRKFIHETSRRYGLGRAASLQLWDAVRKAARDRHITMRGFGPEEFQAIINDVNLSDWDKQAIGARGLADSVARAMDSDLAMVGLTSKLTGKMKTRTAKYNNYVGQLAEKIYPLIRFNMNPIFQMQEFIEPYFFNALRGVKFGYKFTQDQVGMYNLLDEFAMAEHLADGFEAREFMMAGQMHARNMAGPGTTLARISDDMPYGVVGTPKRMNYYNLLRRQFGDNFHAALEREMPGQWARLEAMMNELDVRAGRKGNLSRGEVAERWLFHRGGYDPDNPWASIHHYDGAVPNEFGQIRGINASYLAKQFGFPDGKAMRAAAADPLDNRVTEWRIREDLVTYGFTPDYAKRAWAVLTGPSVEEFLDSVQGQFSDVGLGFHRDLAEALINRFAIAKGISVDEYVARKFTEPAEWVDRNARLPIKAYTQLANRLALEWEMPPLARDDPRFADFSARVHALFPKDPPKKEVISAHRNAAAREQAGTAPPILPTQIAEPVTIAGLDIRSGKTAAEFTQWIDEAGLTPEDVADIALWYEELAGMFGGIAYGMDDATVNSLLPMLQEKNPTLAFEDARAEIGARLFMSWMSTQVQASPQYGMMSALTLMDEVARGKRVSVTRKPHMYSIQSNKYYAMLRDFDANLPKEGFGVKLYDFSDSSMATITRSFAAYLGGQKHLRRSTGQLVDMEPGAMDIWAMRERGFIDGPMLTYLAERLARSDPAKYGTGDAGVAKAIIDVQKETKFLVRRTKDVPVFDSKTGAAIMTKGGTQKVKKVAISADEYRADMRAFEKEHGLPEGTMKAAWEGTPTPAEYEKALKQYNDLTDELNAMNEGEGWAGRGYNSNPWTVRDIQAIAWVQMRNEFEVPDYNIQHFNSAQFQFPVTPTPHMPITEAIPLHRATEHARDLVSMALAEDLAERVTRLVGVQITRVVPGTQGATAIGIVDNTFWEVMGSPEQLRDAARVIAYLTQSDVIHGIKPSETQNATVPGKVWALDFVVSEPDARVLDGLGRWLDAHQGDGFQWNGYGTGSMNDGRMAVRAVYDPEDATLTPMRRDGVGGGIQRAYDEGGVAEGQRLNVEAEQTQTGGRIDLSDPEVMARIMAGESAEGLGAQTLWQPVVVPKRLSRKKFEQQVRIDGVEAKLRDGSWALEAGFDHPIPVDPQRTVYDNYSVRHDWADDSARADARINAGADAHVAWSDEMGRGLLEELERDGRAATARALVTDDMAGFTAVADAALQRADSEAWSAGRGRSSLIGAYRGGSWSPERGGFSPDPNVALQVGRNNRGQPVWNAATAWARDVDRAQRIARGQLRDRTGRVIFREGRANVTSVGHELLHIFADDLEPSAVKTVHDAFFASPEGKAYLANGGTKPRGKHAHNRVFREAEEWMAAQFEEWLATGVAPNGTMNSVFIDYANYYQTLKLNATTLDPNLEAMFGKMTPEMHKGPAALYNVDEYRLMEVARQAFLRAEEEAFRTHYYRRGRTFLERSINHPYLGLYPASYMWGKVLPELMRFLVKKPFGIDAPFAGLAMSNHVFEAIQLQLATDDGEMQDLIADFPEALRFLLLMVPGTPWDIPVNMPAWTRRLSQAAWEGREADIGGAISDTVNYAFGPGRAPADFQEFAQQIIGIGGAVGSLATTGQYESEADRNEKAKQEGEFRRAGLLPPEPEEASRLQFGGGLQ